MGPGVPDRLGLGLRAARRVFVAAGARGDGVDDLAVGERVTVPPEVRLKIDGRLGGSRADDEPQVRLVEARAGWSRTASRRRPRRPSRRGCGGLGTASDRHDGQRLGLVALVAADLEWQSPPVDQQPDDDLRVDASFLGVADLAQPARAVVLLLGFEVKRGDVVEHQADVAVGHRVLEARLRDLIAVGTRVRAPQGAFAGRETRRDSAHLGQHAVDVEQAGGLDDPCDHQVEEDLVTHDVEPEAGVHLGQRVVEQPRGRLEHPWPRRHRPRRCWRVRAGKQTGLRRWRNHRGPRHRRCDPEVKNPLLVIGQQPVSLLQQQPELGFVARGADVANDPTSTIDRFSDLHRSGPRGRPNTPNPGHRPILPTRISALLTH